MPSSPQQHRSKSEGFMPSSPQQHRSKSEASNKGKGKQLKKKTKKAEDETDIIFDYDCTCCNCGKCQPPGLNLKQSLSIVGWAQCDNCDGWFNLKYCSPVTSVSENDVCLFVCWGLTSEQQYFSYIQTTENDEFR